MECQGSVLEAGEGEGAESWELGIWEAASGAGAIAWGAGGGEL